MKISVFISILIIACRLNSGTAQISFTSDKASVDLRIISFHWHDKGWGQSESDTVIFCLHNGQEFGDNNSAPLFKIIEIIDSKSVKIKIPEGCEALGDFPGHSVTNNPMIISGTNNCFRMISPESKTDYCIDLLKVNF